MFGGLPLGCLSREARAWTEATTAYESRKETHYKGDLHQKEMALMADNTKVLVNFIQDRSGSMATVWAETLSGFKEFVKDLKEKGEKDGIDYLFSLTTFDTLIEQPINGKPIKDVKEDALAEFGPRGSTALYDAVGKALEGVKADTISKFIAVVVTDGQENSSREWTKEALNAAIEAKLNAGNWSFVYLGTQPETWDDATSIGVGIGATASYTPAMASMAYASTSHAVHAMSASSSFGTRSLLSRYGNKKMMRAAGMGMKPDAGTPAKPKPPIIPVAKKATRTLGSKRWR
jgi:hypothetical protein